MQRLSISGTLMNYNQLVCRFAIEDDICTEFIILCEDPRYLPDGCNPVEYQNYKDNLVGFFYERTTPSTRQGLGEELKKIGFGYYDMSKLIMCQHGSAQDPFWIRQDTGPQTWEELREVIIERARQYRLNTTI